MQQAAPTERSVSALSSLASSGDSAERGISEGVTSDSGLSDELGGGGAHRNKKHMMADRRTARVTTQLAARVTSICSMCDQELSTYMCSSCGRLSFCLKCCVSLHDNRFLGGHKIEDLRNGLEVTVTTLRERQLDLKSAAIGRSAHFEEDLAAEQEAAEAAIVAADAAGESLGRAELVGEDDPGALDLPALAADQAVIYARLKELNNCAEILKKVGIEITHELEVSREATCTAVEAVKRKFDILRTLINAKEEEFVTIVEEAGRGRLANASKGQTEANVVVSELQGFVTHTDNQLDRLKGNKRLFNTSRRSMLETSETKLNDADNSIHSLQDRLEAVRHQSLGLHISLEQSVEAIQRLKPPTSLTQRSFDPPHVQAVSSQSFVDTPGVKAFTQDREVAASELDDNSFGLADLTALAPVAQRQSFDKEISKLRASPLPSRKNENSPARKPPTHSSSSAATTNQAAPSAQNNNNNNNNTSSLIQRTAARRQQGGGPSPTTTTTTTTTTRTPAGSGGAPRSSIFPPELEALRKQVSGNRSLSGSTTTTTGGGGMRSGSPKPMARTNGGGPRTPTRVGTPTRGGGGPSGGGPTNQGGGTPTRGGSRTGSPMGRRHTSAGGIYADTVSSRASYDGNNPGPGSYGGQPNFGTRSILSTPPRRR